MAALQVRDFPADLHEQIKERARLDHRSVSQEVVVMLRQGVATAPEPRHVSIKVPAITTDGDPSLGEKHRRIMAEIDALPRFEVPEGFPSPEELVREDRDSR